MALFFKFLFRLSVLSIFSVALAVHGESSSSTGINTDRLLDDYRNSWTIADPARRIALLQKIWIAEGVHESPFGRSEGIQAISAEIGGFLEMFPGATVDFTDVRRTGNHVVCNFILTSADGKVVLTGIDYFKLAADGRLVRVVGFAEGAGLPPQ